MSMLMFLMISFSSSDSSMFSIHIPYSFISALRVAASDCHSLNCILIYSS
jgi:hypothetical protein